MPRIRAATSRSKVGWWPYDEWETEYRWEDDEFERKRLGNRLSRVERNVQWKHEAGSGKERACAVQEEGMEGDA